MGITIRRYKGGAFVVAASAAMLVVSTALADGRSISFESYANGTIQGQDGWNGSGIPISPAIDQSIVTNGPGAPASFGNKSWRFSNAYTDGAFGNWPFSPSLANEAGEASAQGGAYSGGVRQTHYEVQWQFTSADSSSYQAGLQMSTASDRGDGARMTYIRMEDHADGLAVFFDDYHDVAPFGGAVGDPNGCGLEDDFSEAQIASGLSRSAAHTVKLTVDFVNGPRNDVVKAYVDGSLRITGTTWEDYFRYCEGNPTRTVDSQIFQARAFGGTAAGSLGRGFLLDNLSYVSSTPPADGNSCKKDGWQGVTRGDGSAFKNQGDCIQYVNTGK